MTWRSHTTSHIAPVERAAAWSAVIADVYFPLELTYRDADRFRGLLTTRTLDAIEVSRLRTEPLQYERLAHHIGSDDEEEFLVTLPQRSPIVFRQMNREVECAPGGFILERGDAPYRFSYANRNDLIVLKVPKPLLTGYLRDPDRHCARIFDARSGMGALLACMAQQLHREDIPPAGTSLLSRHVLELLTMALEDPASGASARTTAVRAAHLRRAQEVIRANLADASLTPQMIADACAISKRYLHDLFRDRDETISHYIREQRLLCAKRMLEVVQDRSIADIAYRFGFADQAQFSRLFKARFGLTPSACRCAARTARQQ